MMYLLVYAQVWDSARYWRLLIMDHHGGTRMALSQVGPENMFQNRALMSPLSSGSGRFSFTRRGGIKNRRCQVGNVRVS